MITVPVRQIAHCTPRTRLLNLDLRSTDFAFAAGQAVMIGLRGSSLRKPYSIASAPWEVRKSGIMQVLVQIEDSGGPDPHLELASPGTPLDLEGPFGSFALPDADPPLVFIAGGTGIAPLRSMLIERAARPTAHPMTLIYSARSADEFAFRADFSALEAAARLRTFFTVTRQEGEWPGRRGRISDELLREALPSTEAACLLCGPPALIEDTRAHLERLGIARDRILIEKY